MTAEQFAREVMNTAEQAEFVELARGLSPDQWSAPSLCSGLSVCDVVVHIAAHIHGEPSTREIAQIVIRSGFSIARTEKRIDSNQQRRHAWRTPENLIAWLAEPMESPDSLTQLSEMVIHQQDIRRPLGVTRAIPADRLGAVLDYSLKGGSRSVNYAHRRVRGLRFVATDMPWVWGTGPEVVGPGEALVMAVNGRGEALHDLSGPGLTTLTRRTANWSAKFA